jgi:hypothetical protein
MMLPEEEQAAEKGDARQFGQSMDLFDIGSVADFNGNYNEESKEREKNVLIHDERAKEGEISWGTPWRQADINECTSCMNSHQRRLRWYQPCAGSNGLIPQWLDRDAFIAPLCTKLLRGTVGHWQCGVPQG